MITLSIDVLKLNKARFKEVTRRNGDKALFCELVLVDTPNSEHGDYIVKQSVTKEERHSGVEMPILGNGKIWAKQRASTAIRQQQRPATSEPDAPPKEGDDVPFSQPDAIPA